MKNSRNYLLLALKGVAMGAADVIPGVSGGTIAFITGIYEELLNSIKSINTQAFKLLLSFKLREFWKHVNGNFLTAVVGGVGISIISLAKLMTFLLTNYPIFIWSFFFGLIIASSLMVAREIKKWNIATIISMIVGIAVAYWITVATPATTPNDWWFIILTGSIAICAMILPGISGSFIMLLMGKYMYIMDAVSTLNLKVLGLFAMGAFFGITTFSHILSWLLKRYHSITVSLLTGFMLGSLNKVWPWKEVVKTYVDRHGVEKPLLEANILPQTYEEIGGGNSFLWEAVVMCIIGFAIIYIIELIGNKLKKL